MTGKTKRKISVIVGAILFIISIVLIVRFISDEPADNEKTFVGAENISVKTVTVHLADYTPIIKTTGEAHAKNMVELYADVTGTLLKTPKSFKSGMAFRKGEILLSIDKEERQLSVESSKEDFYSLLVSLLPEFKNDYPESYANWEIYVDKFSRSKQMSPLPEPQNKKEKYFLASRKVRYKYLAIKSSEINLKKYTIRAPFTGILLEGDLNPGALVRAGQKLGEFVQTGFYEVQFDVPINRIIDIKIGTHLSITADAFDDTIKTKISRIGKTVDKSTQTVTIYADVKNKKLTDGLFISAKIALSQVHNAFRIDRKYLTQQKQLIQIEDNKLQFISPQIEGYQNNQAIVTGVHEGAIIVNQLLPGAYEGMQVNFNKNESL